jgi:hypothetical protein
VEYLQDTDIFFNYQDILCISQGYNKEKKGNDRVREGKKNK